MHAWPSARGHVGNYSNYEGVAPKDLDADYWWSFHHPNGWFHSVCLGVVIDDVSCLYLSCDDAIRKFSPDGRLLWKYSPEVPSPRPFSLVGLTIIGSIPSLMGGALFGSTHQGFVFSLDLASGREIWSVKVSHLPDHLGRTLTGDDNNFVGAHDGVVVTMKDRCLKSPPCSPHGGSMALVALNATDGSLLWDFEPDAPFWNFFPLFSDDGTFAFQDLEGRAYRLQLSDGKQLWKAGGIPNTWTDGTAMLGPNGLVYAVSLTRFPGSPFDAYLPGVIWAFRFSDGQLVWKAQTPMPVNSWPLLARLPGRGSLSVVMPIAMQGGNPGQVMILDAETGAEQSNWDGPRGYGAVLGGGDVAGSATRVALGLRPGCGPNPWSAPSVDAAGAIYVGFQDSRLYRYHDANGDGRLDQRTEVSSFLEGAHASPAAGAAFAPGLMAHCSCDGLFVFKA